MGVDFGRAGEEMKTRKEIEDQIKELKTDRETKIPKTKKLADLKWVTFTERITALEWVLTKAGKP